jgi:phenylacetate-CoA ligase
MSIFPQDKNREPICPKADLSTIDCRFWEKDIETASRDYLRTLQEERLREQLGYVYDHSPFYRARFTDRGFHPNDFGSIEDLGRIPQTRKDDLREAAARSRDPLPHLCVSKRKIAAFGCSRGTTGVSTFSAFTQEDLDLRVKCYTRSLVQLALTAGDFFHSMIGLQSPTHFVLRDASRKLDVVYLNDGVDNPSVSVQIGKLLRPNVLFTGVRAFFEMEKILEKEALSPKEVLNYAKIVLYGDVVSNHLTEYARKKWGVHEVFSLGGSAADILWYNFDCPYHMGNHCLNEDMFLIEVIDPETGRTVGSGEKGELVVTDLVGKGAPHIRWNLEDMVIPFYEPCLCGRTHVRLKYLGRSLYEISVMGRPIFPAEIEYFLWQIEEVRPLEFRIVKYAKEMDHLRLQIESPREGEGLKAKISRHLEDRLGVEVQLEILPRGGLPVMDIKTPRVIDLTSA